MALGNRPAFWDGNRVELSVGTWRVVIQRTVPGTVDLARMYDGASWLWHPVMNLLGHPRAYTNLFNRLAADGWLECLPQGAKVLDGGIGTAAFSLALAKAIPFGALEIHGIDISPRMLARARHNLRRLGHAGITAQLRYGNADCLPYPAGDFDMVMSAHMLEHSSDPSATLGEMARVLRAGAPLLIVTTRADRVSAWHGLRWRYRSIESQQLQHWLHLAGLCDVRRYALGGSLRVPGPASEAYIGRKM